MTTYTKLALLLNGIVQNVDLSTAELVLDSLKVGGASGTALTKTTLDSLIANSHVSGSDNQTITAGSGLTGGGSGATVTLDVNVGDGIQISSDAVAAKLDGTTLSVSGAGLKVNSISNSEVAAAAGILESKLTLDYSTASLNTAISGKEPTISAGTTSQYWRGDKSWQTLDTAAVTENASYLYFTDARAKTAAVVNSTAGSQTDQAASVSSMKAYVTSQVASAGTAAEWQDSVISRLATPPGSPATGDRYLIIATATGDWATKEDQIAQWSGSAWAYTVCTNGTYVSVDAETDGLYYFGGTWTKKYYEATTASNGLTKVGMDIRIDSSAAGSGLGFSAGVLAVNVDATTIDIATDALYLKSVGQLVSSVFVSFTNNTGSTISAGSVVALSQTAAGEIILADADALSTSEGTVGVVVADIANAASGKVQVAGEATVLNGGTAFDLGKRVYLSGTAGQGTKTAPSGAGKVIFLLGNASATNKVILNTQLVGVDA